MLHEHFDAVPHQTSPVHRPFLPIGLMEYVVLLEPPNPLILGSSLPVPESHLIHPQYLFLGVTVTVNDENVIRVTKQEMLNVTMQAPEFEEEA